MGYVPPQYVISSPEPLSPQEAQDWASLMAHSSAARAYQTLYLTKGADLQVIPGWDTPRMVLRQTYESWRREIYGWPAYDWFPIANSGLLLSGIALIATLLWAIFS